MFNADAALFAPYFDTYPNPSLTDNHDDITLGNYGLDSSSISPNPLWRIYPSRLGLGQGVFESTGWSEAYAASFDATNPWFIRGGPAQVDALAGLETVSTHDGTAIAYFGFREVVT